MIHVYIGLIYCIAPCTVFMYIPHMQQVIRTYIEDFAVFTKRGVCMMDA